MTWEGPRTLGAIVAAKAAARPDHVFVTFEDGGEMTLGTWDESANRFANAALDLGIEPGDKVAVMLENGPEFLAVWVGAAKAGLVEVPVNTGSRGDQLAHVLDKAQVSLVVVDARWLDRIVDVADRLPGLRHVAVVGDASDHTAPMPPGIAVHALDELLAAAVASAPAVDVSPFDPASIMFTSGTTGPSKGAVRSHESNFTMADQTVELMRYQPGEVLFTAFPLFHLNAKGNTVLTALVLDGSVVVHTRFHATTFWETCRARGVTAFNYMGAVLMMLHKQPPRPDDAANPVLKAYGAPAPAEIFEDFQDRFGVQLVEVYGSTECGIVTANTIDDMRLGTCGRAADIYDVEIHDADGNRCPAGVPGEIVVRPRRPSVMFSGYHGDAEATVEAFRNLWFHTGDRGVEDEHGSFTFLDRMKDSIRRRGENISSWEVEKAINALDGVQESAVVGVPSELSEEEVLAVVVPKPGAALSPGDVVDEVRRRMPPFAVPRYVRFVDELPRTPSQRVEKFRLREVGLTGDTWDSQVDMSGAAR